MTKTFENLAWFWAWGAPGIWGGLKNGEAGKTGKPAALEVVSDPHVETHLPKLAFSFLGQSWLLAL